MLATLSRLPKWLLAVVAVCILTGYSQQVDCKLTGCKSTVVASADSAVHGDPSAPLSDDDHCQCQCHFVTLSPCELPMFCVRFVRAASTAPLVWIENAPEAPCADIDHPPQLV